MKLLYEIWPYRELFIICPGVENPIYSSSNASYVKLHLYITVRGYGFFRQPVVFDEINQLLPVPHNDIKQLLSIAQCLVICAVWHSIDPSYASWLCQLGKVNCRCWAHTDSQTHCQSQVVSSSIPPLLLNLACTFVQNLLKTLLLNPFSIMNIFQRQPVLVCHQNNCNCSHPGQGTVLKMFQMVLSLDNNPRLLFQNPSHLYFISLVEDTKVELPHSFGKLRQGEFRLFQTDWDYAFCTAQVQHIAALTIWVVFNVDNVW
jgi:hypothetical protein